MSSFRTRRSEEFQRFFRSFGSSLIAHSLKLPSGVPGFQKPREWMDLKTKRPEHCAPAFFLMPEKLLSRNRLDRHKASHASAIHELYLAADFGKERVIASPANIQARFQTRAALPHNDRSASNELAAECLYAQPLRVRVATVIGTSAAFFMCHFSILIRRSYRPKFLRGVCRAVDLNLVDPNLRERLTVSLQLLVLLLPLVVENQNLIAASFT